LIPTIQQALPATGLKDLNLSKLMLGTAQFGMPYGIANLHGRPSYEEVREILAAAFEGGVNCLDTAASYGEGEEIVGRALRELNLVGRIIVVTKIRHLPDMPMSGRAADAFVQRSVEDSLRRLRLEEIPVCLFHRQEDFRCVESLLKLKQKGLVRHIGCSVMDLEPTRAILNSGLAEAVQIPANLLDRRFERAGVCRHAESRSVGLFVRSVFLQGLLLIPESAVPPELSDAIPARRALERLSVESGMTIAEMALRYTLGVDGVISVLAGVETVGQLRQNLTYVGRGPLDAGLINRFSETVPDLPDSILKPSLWPPTANASQGQKVTK